MTARDRLLRARRELVVALVVRAGLASLGTGLAALAIARLLALPIPLVLVAAIATAGVMLARARAARSLERVALWVEERHPSLRYALVTLVDPAPVPAGVEAQALALPWWKEVRRATARVVIVPATVVLVLSLLLLLTPDVVGSTARRVGVTGALSRPGAPPMPTLSELRATVVPPAYARRPETTLDDPTGVEALEGSIVTVSGAGDAALVAATIDSAGRAVASRGQRWSVTLPMPARPALLRLRVRGNPRERLIVLAPVTDAPPVVTLLLPARDTVMRVATGTLRLHAQLRDDIGLRDAAFELVISSGRDENFTFRSATIGRVALGDAGERALEARLSLDSLALGPGDVLQLRAVARDGNTVSGPGTGSSETRSLRVARAGEYDSVSVDPAPPAEPEGQVLSQRMLIMLTEALEKRRARLARPVLLDESRRIAADQAKLRKRVGDIVFQRMGGEPLSEEGDVPAAADGKITPEELLRRAEEATAGTTGSVMDVEGDETPILAVNKPLLEAFNAMWDAGRSLEQGELVRALPAMRRALAAIERARQAERIYLRGRPSAVVIDLAKARLAGKDKGTASLREPRPAADPTARRRAARFAHVTTLLARDPAAAVDTLLVLRVEALVDAPPLAAALDDAARALRRGDSGAVAIAWQRVRRALAGAPAQRETLGLWGGAP